MLHMMSLVIEGAPFTLSVILSCGVQGVVTVDEHEVASDQAPYHVVLDQAPTLHA